ncbi:MAG: isoaspartyl peptidase/L-asparaginase [Myxococcota bacterium]
MPTLILHGGAGGIRKRSDRDRIAESLHEIAQSQWEQLKSGSCALDVVIEIVRRLEADPLFNAGVGSKLQRDGGARLSAALMDGSRERFSGVVNVQGLMHPITLCSHLLEDRDRVLCGEGAFNRAQELGLEEGDVRTPKAIQDWKQKVEGSTGTVGAVVLDAHGNIAAATSTGGRGMERVGRVSDSCTVAGNYASSFAGVSCTGIGEDIVDGTLATRVVHGVEHGLSIKAACERVHTKMMLSDWSAGLIALDKSGDWAAIQTTEIMYWHAIDDAGVHRFKDPDGPCADS